MADYYCFKTRDRDVYCSSAEFRGHAEADAWVKACIEHFGLKRSDLHGNAYPCENRPEDATIWP